MRAFAGGSGTKYECRGRERDQIRYISAGAGGRGTEKSVPRRSLASSTAKIDSVQKRSLLCVYGLAAEMHAGDAQNTGWQDMFDCNPNQ